MTFELDRTQVLTELKRFLHQVMEMAVSQGYSNSHSHEVQKKVVIPAQAGIQKESVPHK